MPEEAILVAGGAGYIGSHTCKALQAQGFLPVVFDDLRAGHREFVRFGPLVEASLDNHAALQQTLQKYAIQSVIDFSGSIEVGESVQKPLMYYENNAAVKLGFLQCLQSENVKHIIFSSTAAVYGEPHITPIPETHPLTPKNPYGWSKLFFERILADFHAAGGPSYMALRYFNAAGASPDGDIGEAHEPESHLIPRACMAALGKIPALEIFGDDYPTPDGTALRDYVHVSDLSEAHVKALLCLKQGAASSAYNLGTGKAVSIREIMQAFAALGHHVPHVFAPRRAGDPAVLVADVSKTRENLNWSAQYSDINHIISSAMRWHQRLQGTN